MVKGFEVATPWEGYLHVRIKIRSPCKVCRTREICKKMPPHGRGTCIRKIQNRPPWYCSLWFLDHGSIMKGECVLVSFYSDIWTLRSRWIPAKTNPGLKMKKELLKSPPGVGWHFFGPEHTRIVLHLHIVKQGHSSYISHYRHYQRNGSIFFLCWCTSQIMPILAILSQICALFGVPLQA